MMQPTYRIAQALHERRAAVGLKKYGEYLTANSPGCMIVHALEEAADLTEYLLAEMQRRSEAITALRALREVHGGMVPDSETVAAISHVIDLLGGEAALAKYDEILGTVAENATVDPSDEALRVAQNTAASQSVIYALLEELEAEREAVRRLSQANGDLRQERDRAVAEAQRQDGVAKGLRKERDQLATTPAQSPVAHDAALLRSLAAKLDGEGHPANEYYRNWLRAEADRIEKEAKSK